MPLSFAGYYDLDADHLYDKFASRQDGIGYPDWVEDRRDPNEFSLYCSAPQAALSTHTEQSRPFPWELPSLSQASFSATKLEPHRGAATAASTESRGYGSYREAAAGFLWQLQWVPR